jgi:hypothetical protein
MSKAHVWNSAYRITDIATPQTRMQTAVASTPHTRGTMRKTILMLGALMTLALTRAASAQKGEPDLDGLEPFFAYLALISTPTGGLPDAVPFWMTGAQGARPGFRAAFGYLDLEGGSLRNFAGTFDIPFGQNDVGVTVGYLSPDCGDADCDGHIMFGADYSRPLVRSAPGSSSQFTLGVLANVGYAKPDLGVDVGTDVDLTAWSGSVGAPLSIALPSGNVKIIPFLTPAAGWGQISASVDAGGTDLSVDIDDFRFLLSGGVGVSNLAPGLTINAGLKKVFVEDGDILFGIGVSWNGVR